ncbi:hypothetical protein BT63DRAFT_377242 [Microthyrium microscopicum]|uniref:EamA domain-containing protein n=1 Tax=Microthyrium microscopicum TaxID=703497 RepID=A0A6A6U3A1_9PEZI|nr:hypothetical protein BT63DRAFT_377242 [Microthyrium microscopicum]
MPNPHYQADEKDSGRRHGVTGFLHSFWGRNKGLVLVLIAQIFGVLMNVTTRLLELEGNNGKGMHPFQILLARMFITVVLASLYMYYTKTPDFPLGAKPVRKILVARGLGGFFGVFGMYYSLQYLPLADATVITFLAPGMACWACSYFLKEPFTRTEQIAALISLFGVVLIARPASLFSSNADQATEPLAAASIGNTTISEPEDRFSYDNVTPEQRIMAVMMAMLGVFGAACALTTLRWIGNRAHPLISVNYFATWCTIVSAVAILFFPGVDFVLPANLKEWTLLGFLGICGFIMQYLLAAGLAVEKSSRATNMIYTQMLFALGFDKLIFGTNPALLSMVGSSLILSSAIYVAIQKANNQVPPTSKDPRSVDASEELGLVQHVDSEDLDASSSRSP